MKEFPRVFVSDFNLPTTKAIKGFGAMFHMDGGLIDSSEIIIVAPDWGALQRAWKLLSKNDCVRDKCADVTGFTITETQYTLGAGTSKEVLPHVQEAATGLESLIWVYDIPNDKIYVGGRWMFDSPSYSGANTTYAEVHNLREIGPAKDFTSIECKQLLLKAGWGRQDIREVKIVDGYDDIPF